MSDSIIYRLQTNPITISILIFDAITLIFSFFLPFISLVYVGDLFTLIGMVTASIYLVKTEKKKSNTSIIRSIIIVSTLGGLIVSFSLSLVFYLLGTAAGIGVRLGDAFLYYIRWTILIALVSGFFTFGCYLLSQNFKEKEII
jgi:hypothetical protein